MTQSGQFLVDLIVKFPLFRALDSGIRLKCHSVYFQAMCEYYTEYSIHKCGDFFHPFLRISLCFLDIQYFSSLTISFVHFPIAYI